MPKEEAPRYDGRNSAGDELNGENQEEGCAEGRM